jgi:hypothetical protein
MHHIPRKLTAGRNPIDSGSGLLVVSYGGLEAHSGYEDRLRYEASRSLGWGGKTTALVVGLMHIVAAHIDRAVAPFLTGPNANRTTPGNPFTAKCRAVARMLVCGHMLQSRRMHRHLSVAPSHGFTL